MQADTLKNKVTNILGIHEPLGACRKRTEIRIFYAILEVSTISNICVHRYTERPMPTSASTVIVGLLLSSRVPSPLLFSPHCTMLGCLFTFVGWNALQPTAEMKFIYLVHESRRQMEFLQSVLEIHTNSDAH